MSWPTKPLGELATFRNGLNYTKANFGRGIKVINVKDFQSFAQPEYDTLDEIDPAGLVDDDDILRHGDIVFVRSNGNRELVGRSLLINEPPEPIAFSAFAIRARFTDCSSVPHFYAHFFRSPEFRRRLSLQGAGTNICNLNQTILRHISVPAPPPDIQVEVSAVLNTYDDLITNSRRRMTLLEEAAQLLYHEWFVRLRYPGHEHVRAVEGVPTGWERVPLGQRITLNYGKALKADDRIEGPFPVFGSSGIVGTHEKPLVNGPGIVVGRKGNVGSVYWSPIPFFPIDTVYFIAPDTSDLYLYYAIKQMQFISTDVAVPGLNRDFAYSRPLLCPARQIRDAFLDAVSPIHTQLAILDELNSKLREARDLLLPRLMSSEITVKEAASDVH
ncbi:MAG: restriction endonuclease subunit S [Phycisphaerae bacterium]|nr:restriction endonuclease subunit S [Phycisphaerae bacterium]